MNEPPGGDYLDEQRPSIARNAAVLSAASMTSRVLGLVREIIIPHYFGATGYVSAFRTAEFIIKNVYELLVGGMLSAALVPVLSDYNRPERRAAFSQVASIIFTALSLVAAIAVLTLEVLAPQIILLLGKDLAPEFQQVAITLLRIMAPIIWIFSSSGALAAILFARQRFTRVALGDALYNIGVIITVPLLYRTLNIKALALGIMLGSLIQLTMRLPDLRGVHLRLTRHFRHPALRRIWLLYMPVFVALMAGLVQGAIDTRLFNSTGAQSMAYRGTATTLYQFPHGLVAVAVSLASLPTLSRWAAEQDWMAFRRTLGAGLRAVLVLVMPAAVGLWVLAAPTVRLLAEHGGKFTPHDTYQTARLLQFYLPGLIFASIDWPLNFSYYARGDSRTPAIVGILAIFVYLIVAFSLLPLLSFFGLGLADGAKQAAHALMMIYLLHRWKGRMGQGVLRTTGQTLAAATVMGVVVFISSQWLLAQLGTEGLFARVMVLLVPGVLGGGIYYFILRWLKVPEVALVHRLFRRVLPN
ncbi:MAG: murein biosynthesis integral membrane protein MurJ [Clostridia bacterium]|nr:MAG: murein biosynthesis integral membrane protein MurJ [Clostridia bacterium]